MTYRTRQVDGGALERSSEEQQLLHDLQVHQLELEMQNEELRRVQHELDASRLRYFELYDFAPVGYCTVSDDGLILEANLAAAALLGVDRRALVGKPFSRFIVPEDAAAFHLLRRDLAEQGAAQVHEFRIRRADDTQRWVLLSASGAAGEGGTALLRIVLSDITDRKRAEEALRINERDLREAEQVAKVGHWRWDVERNQVFWSDEMRRIWGIDPESVGRDVAAIVEQRVHPDDRERVLAMSAAAVAGRATPLEYRIVLPTIGVRTVLATPGQSVHDGTRLTQLSGTAQDVTDTRRMEAERALLQSQLSQAQQMQSIGRLAGGVAHDFNNMLAVIMGNAEFALGEIDASHPLHEPLAEIQRAAKRSAVLTRQLLGFARQQRISPRTLDVNASVSDLLSMLRRLMGPRITLEWTLGEQVWPVSIDPAQLANVLTNLCLNARDAIAEAGTITLSTANVVVDARQARLNPDASPGEYVRIDVRDTGHGMDEHTRAQIFEPFFTTKDVGEGTGLGLSSVYGAVRQNEGFITVESAPGKGSTFSVHLPRRSRETPTGNAVVTPSRRLRGRETILLVEDEPGVLRLLTRILQAQGYTVLTATSPREAVRVSSGHQGEIRLLLTDALLTEMNGRELAELLRTGHPRLRVLFMSGQTASHQAESGAKETGTAFIQKPFSYDALATSVRAVLDAP